MALPRYLAMTQAEFTACSSPPEHLAWMACHFSPYGTGLVDLPPALPPHSMVILNDRIPMAGHDPDTVIRQLRELNMDCLMLDLQHPPEPGILEMARRIVDALSCPVGAPEAYCENGQSPVFLSFPPPDVSIEKYLSPWQGREIWLELALDGISYGITAQGAVPCPLRSVPEHGQQDRELFCHYRIAVSGDQATIDLWRTRQDLDLLLEAAKSHGVTKAVGLWQELAELHHI